MGTQGVTASPHQLALPTTAPNSKPLKKHLPKAPALVVRRLLESLWKRDHRHAFLSDRPFRNKEVKRKFRQIVGKQPFPGSCYGYAMALVETIQNTPTLSLSAALKKITIDQVAHFEAAEVLRAHHQCGKPFPPACEEQFLPRKERKAVVQYLKEEKDYLVVLSAWSKRPRFHHSFIARVAFTEGRFEFFNSTRGAGLYAYDDFEAFKAALDDHIAAFLPELSRRSIWKLDYYHLGPSVPSPASS